MTILTDNLPIVTKKAKNLLSLSSNGITIPSTIICHEFFDNIKSILISECNLTENTGLYVRIVFRDDIYPHYYCNCVNVINVDSAIKSLVNRMHKEKINNWDLIIQPIIEFKWSGAILTQKEFTIIEIVHETSDKLLRDGEVNIRLLFNEKNKIIDQQGPMKIDLKHIEYLQYALNSVRKYTYRNLTSKVSISEFGFCNNSIMFVDIKELPCDTYAGISKGKIIYPLFSQEKDPNLNGKRIMKIDKPCFSYINDICNVSLIEINRGALLSHLAINAIELGVQCKFMNY